MKVMKFGGTSVGSPERIKHVAELICEESGCRFVVLSAMSGTTNSLIRIADTLKSGDKEQAIFLTEDLRKKYADVIAGLFSEADIINEAAGIVSGIFNDILDLCDRDFSKGLYNELVAKGEIISTNLMNEYFKQEGVKVAFIPALDFMMKTDKDEPDFSYIKGKLSALMAPYPDYDLFLTQGFICRNPQGEIDNLQRGGSDYTASIIGAALDADEIQIWTDIDGMHNNDPRFVDNTSPVHNLHFEEAAELAYFGAKILHPTCILPAKENDIPVRLLNTMDPTAEGTLIDHYLAKGEIQAVAAKDNITAIKIKSSRMLLAYGFLKKVFEVFEKYQTPIDMIATSEVGVSLTIDDEKHLNEIVEELQHFGTVTIDRDMAIICVVGDLDWHNVGYESKILNALSEIPLRMISYGGSNYNVSILISQEDKVKALNLLSRYLFNRS